MTTPLHQTDWLSALGGEVWAYLIISDPSLRARLVERKAVRQAVDWGRQVAQQVSVRFPEQDAAEILKALGVRVIMTQDNPRWGTRLQCAEYQRRPPQVRIYEQAMEAMARVAEDCQLDLFAHPTVMREASLAHELYHHLERTEFSPLSRQFRLPSRRIGPFTLHRQVAQLDEVAAHAFAQALCGLASSPGIVELLMRYTSPSGRAQLLQQSREIHTLD